MFATRGSNRGVRVMTQCALRRRTVVISLDCKPRGWCDDTPAIQQSSGTVCLRQWILKVVRKSAPKQNVLRSSGVMARADSPARLHCAAVQKMCSIYTTNSEGTTMRHKGKISHVPLRPEYSNALMSVVYVRCRRSNATRRVSSPIARSRAYALCM